MAARGGQFSARGGRTLKRKAREKTNHAIGSKATKGSGKMGAFLRHGTTGRLTTGGKSGVKAR